MWDNIVILLCKNHLSIIYKMSYFWFIFYLLKYIYNLLLHFDLQVGNVWKIITQNSVVIWLIEAKLVFLYTLHITSLLENKMNFIF